jgi:hypothetical protein
MFRGFEYARPLALDPHIRFDFVADERSLGLQSHRHFAFHGFGFVLDHFRAKTSIGFTRTKPKQRMWGNLRSFLGCKFGLGEKEGRQVLGLVQCEWLLMEWKRGKNSAIMRQKNLGALVCILDSLTASFAPE